MAQLSCGAIDKNLSGPGTMGGKVQLNWIWPSDVRINKNQTRTGHSLQVCQRSVWWQGIQYGGVLQRLWPRLSLGRAAKREWSDKELDISRDGEHVELLPHLEPTIKSVVFVERQTNTALMSFIKFMSSLKEMWSTVCCFNWAIQLILTQ